MNVFRLKSQRGGVGSEWWGEEFIDLMEEVGDVGRLSRGRSYARQGQIRSFLFTEDGIEATVVGSQTYRITITFPRYTSDEKKIIFDWLKSQPVWMSHLFAGKLLEEFADTVREKSKIDIIPEYEQMTVQCTCPDYSEPCKHAAAAYYYLGECIDHDPFLLFSLRGLTKEDILTEFRKARLKNRGNRDNITSDKKDIIKTYYEIQFPLEKCAQTPPDEPKKSAKHVLEWGKAEVKLQRRDIVLWLADVYPSTSSFSRSIMSQLATELFTCSPEGDREESDGEE